MGTQVSGKRTKLYRTNAVIKIRKQKKPMMKNKIIGIVATICLFAGWNSISAQGSTNSPYTRYGYGQLEDDCFSRSQPMGGTAIGMRHPASINPINPASYSSSDSTSFLFEMGVSGLVSTFSGKQSQNTTFTGNLDYVALQAPITKWMGLSLGLIPYSYVGYNYSFKDSLQINGSDIQNKYTQSYYGSGGISQVYLGLSADIANHLAIGVNGYYMFGTLNHYKAISYDQSELTTVNTIKNSSLHVNCFNVRFGLQYHETVGSKHAFTIGAIYEFKSKMSGVYTQTTEGVDTVSRESKELFELPSLYGGGVSYTYDDRFTIGVDYTLQEYSKALFYGKTDSLYNRMKIAVGAEYIHNPRGRKYIDRMCWRLGANYRDSYIKAGNSQSHDFSITCGVGLPLRTSKTMININLEYGNVGSYTGSSLKENYFKFGLNFSLNETWFQKAKIR